MSLARATRIKGEAGAYRQYRRRLADLYRQQGSLRSAIEHYTALVKLAPTGTGEPALAELDQNLAELDQDLAELDQDLVELLADLHREAGDSDAALEVLKKGLTLRPDKAGGHQVMGVLLQEKGRTDEAIPCYRRALELDPELASGHKQLGLALLEKQDFAGAADEIEKYLELKPEAADAASMKMVAAEARKLAGN